MAKNFDSAANAKIFHEVAAKSAERAQVVTVRMIPDSKLRDCEKNQEDISDTTDLENSINELGFTDPIEVTAYGMIDGEYMIISGRRRRVAGRKCGIDLFPCIIKSFNNEAEIQNYVLLANCYRDSAKDPLLYCKRYLLHENYLKGINYEGNIRDAVAARLGLSVQQTDRYAAFNKIITSAWDLVHDAFIGMSSILPLATHNVVEQAEILTIMKGLLNDGVALNRAKCEEIIKNYRIKKNGVKESFGENNDSVDGETSFNSVEEDIYNGGADDSDNGDNNV